jgi:hypothetical protein
MDRDLGGEADQAAGALVIARARAPVAATRVATRPDGDDEQRVVEL